MCLIAAAASWLRGGYYINPEEAGLGGPGTDGDIDAARAEAVVAVAGVE
jgi:hypothetical protein